MSDNDLGRSVIDASARFGSGQRRDHGSVAGGGGPPHDPEMEARVGRLEEDFKEFRAELRAFRTELIGIRTDIAGLRGDVGEVKGRMANLPSTWAMVTTVVGTQVSLAALLTGLVFAVARMFGKV